MPIQVIRNVDGNFLEFRGSTNPTALNNVVSGEVDSAYPDRINVINTTASAAGRNIYEFFQIPFTEFRDDTNASFATAQECADYITAQGNVPFSREVNLDLQGHYGLLSNYYFAGGVATDTVIEAADVDQWVDVNFTIDAEGLYDMRTNFMKEASAVGHTGAGTSADPILFDLEGLTTQSSVLVNASLSFNPDVDESQLDCRLNFFRNSTSSLGNFFVADIAANMNQGAQEDYEAEPLLTFFCGDTISTAAPGDAGSFCFQVRSSSEGTLSLRALTLYISQ